MSQEKPVLRHDNENRQWSNVRVINKTGATISGYVIHKYYDDGAVQNSESTEFHNLDREASTPNFAVQYYTGGSFFGGFENGDDYWMLGFTDGTQSWGLEAGFWRELMEAIMSAIGQTGDAMADGKVNIAEIIHSAKEGRDIHGYYKHTLHQDDVVSTPTEIHLYYDHAEFISVSHRSTCTVTWLGFKK